MATFDYAPAPESRAVVDLQPSYGLFINGEFVDGSGEAFKTINPATEETLAEVARRAPTMWTAPSRPRARHTRGCGVA
jgi:aldehyde dehydrogenase (NAD+)